MSDLLICSITSIELLVCYIFIYNFSNCANSSSKYCWARADMSEKAGYESSAWAGSDLIAPNGVCLASIRS